MQGNHRRLTDLELAEELKGGNAPEIRERTYWAIRNGECLDVPDGDFETLSSALLEDLGSRVAEKLASYARFVSKLAMLSRTRKDQKHSDKTGPS